MLAVRNDFDQNREYEQVLAGTNSKEPKVDQMVAPWLQVVPHDTRNGLSAPWT